MAPNRQAQSSDKRLMTMALDLARRGLGRTSPNPAVGAVLVKNGKVIGTGFHKKAGWPHAEVEALTSPPAPLLIKERGATLYVTLEPCCHYGRTPPCTETIIKSGIKKVVIGMRDPDPKVSGKGIRILRKNGLRVGAIHESPLRREIERFYEPYIKHRKTGLPYVTLKMAITRDCMVASKTGRPRWITGPKARAMVHEMRNRCDGILVGIGTVLKDNPRLTTRLKGKKGHDPVRIILDGSLRTHKKARVLQNSSSSPTWIATTLKRTHPKVGILRKKGAEMLFCRRDRQGRVDLKDLLKQLGERGILSLLVEGGPRVCHSFLSQGLVDEMTLFVAPFTLGKKGVPFVISPESSKSNPTFRRLPFPRQRPPPS